MASLVVHTGFRSFTSKVLAVLTRKTVTRVGLVTSIALGYHFNKTGCEPSAFADDGDGVLIILNLNITLSFQPINLQEEEELALLTGKLPVEGGMAVAKTVARTTLYRS